MDKCSCNGKLIWQCDYDTEDYGIPLFGVVTVYMCPDCEELYTFVMAEEGTYLYKDNEEDTELIKIC